MHRELNTNSDPWTDFPQMEYPRRLPSAKWRILRARRLLESYGSVSLAIAAQLGDCSASGDQESSLAGPKAVLTFARNGTSAHRIGRYGDAASRP